MIGAILAGGRGKRLRPLTEEIPKPLVEIKKGYTILDRQILQFKYSGIEEVYLLVGHKYDKIKKRYGNTWQGIKIRYLEEEKPLGTAGAIRNLTKTAKGSVIVRNGDVVSDVNLKEMMNSHQDNITMFVTPMISPFGIVEMSNGKITNFKEKPVLNYYINAGVYIIPKTLFKYFKFKKGDVEKLIFQKLAKKGLINSYREKCYWKSVDSIKDLKEVKNEYSNREDKPWGYEKTIVSTGKYLTKELYIMKGESTSFHYHAKKDETLHITDGECIIDFEDESVVLNKNDTYRIKPRVKHTIRAVENTLLQEYSTPHPDDTLRINDNYGR